MPEDEEVRLWFVAWRCGCTDVQANKDDVPANCPCHPDAELIGGEWISPGVSTSLGHMCEDEPKQ